MATTVTIDKAGRVVIPKPMREALHIHAGTTLRIRRTGERLTLEPATTAARLTIEDDTPLIHPADPEAVPTLTTEMVRETIERERAARGGRIPGMDDDQG
jgi:AbrB family looped-hinge helix DNA binding protein